MGLPEPRAKEHEMSASDGGARLLGSLRSAGGKGVVRMEERVSASIGEVWSALTDRSRLARWYGDIEGDLRLGGEYRAKLHASGWEGSGRVDACEPQRRLLVTVKHLDDPDEGTIEVTLSADAGQTVVIWEERGMPVDLLAPYGAGIQVHVEDLAAHVGGRERCDGKARWDELFPAYAELAAN
jgi:uncharacterized protein YndB with AHSA1/START domain